EKTILAGGRRGVTSIYAGPSSERSFTGTILRCNLETWLNDQKVHEEVFGATALVVLVPNEDRFAEAANALSGQLTATLHLEDADRDLAMVLLPILERRAGRVLANGFPTGVAVSDAMVHGGPWPASTNFGQTAVGTLSIRRWQRQVCWQNFQVNPTKRDAQLPPSRSNV
ncbi:MAG: hypothetical protein AAGF09_01855, partial [Pseudomonadota bacterium]